MGKRRAYGNKVFGGELYNNYGSWRTKAEAQREAKKIRDKGFKARVVGGQVKDYLRGDRPPVERRLYTVYIGRHR